MTASLPRRAAAVALSPFMWAALVAAGALALYVRTLLPGIVGGDAGELQYAGPILSLVHQTGQPLYVLIGYVWSHVIPIGTVAYRMNLLSAVSAALACGLMVFLLHRVTGNLPVAVIAALTQAFGLEFWTQAVIADKYGFNALFGVGVAGLALWWSKDRDKPYGDRLLYVLSGAFGLALLHHRSVMLFGVGLALMVLVKERLALWRNRRRTLICLALVFGPALVIYPTVLPWLRSRDLTPLSWQPTSASDWLDWILERHIVMGRFLTTDQPDTIPSRLLQYVQGVTIEYSILVIAVAVVGLVAVGLQDPGAALFLGVSYALSALLAANFRGYQRIFIYFVPSYMLLSTAWGLGLDALWRLVRRWLAARAHWVPAAVVAGALIALVAPASEFAHNYSIKREASVYGEPLDIWRQVLRSGTLGDRAVNGLADVPQNAVVVADWETVTALWYAQKVEGVRPDVTLTYPMDLLGDFEKGARPVCLSRHVEPLDPAWHVNGVGALACLSSTPNTVMPAGMTPVGTALLGPDGQPRLELAGYQIASTQFPAWSHIPITLVWRGLADHPEDYSVSLHILTQQWQPVWKQDLAAPVLGMYPTSRWMKGEIVSDYREFDIARDFAPGRYLWTVVVYRQAPDGSFIQLKDAQGNVEILGGTFEVTPR